MVSSVEQPAEIAGCYSVSCRGAFYNIGLDSKHVRGKQWKDGRAFVADVHSIIDALLGALSKGDVGDFFPSSDKKWRGANSLDLLKSIYANHFENWGIGNIDSTIILQAPIIKPYIQKMKENIQTGVITDRISIKATTTDHLGFIGQKKGIAVITTCLLRK